MAKTRLTQWSRLQITNRLISNRFDPEEAALKERRRGIALAVYHDLYPADLFAKMNALPDGWLPTDDGIKVQFGEHSASYRWLHLGAYLPFLAKHHGQCVKKYDQTHEIARAYGDLTLAEADLNERRSKAKVQVRSALEKFRYLEDLTKEWPEAAPFALAFFNAKPAPKLPTLRTSELNALLGLGGQTTTQEQAECAS